MIPGVGQKNLFQIKIFGLLFISFLLLSCDQRLYRGKIAVEQHLWQLKQVDTIYVRGKCMASATWHNKHDRLDYVDNSREFPYPYAIGTYYSNFDRR